MATRSIGKISLAVVALSGCVTPRGAARTRASHEFNCPEDKVETQERSDLSLGTFDVEACGHRARYTCIQDRQLVRCVREPIDADPAAQAIPTTMPATTPAR